MKQIPVAVSLAMALSQCARISRGLIIASFVAFICQIDTDVQALESTTIAQGVSCLIRCDTTKELTEFFEKESLGGVVRIRTKNHLVIVQTFPYSGVSASHLFVYAQESDSLNFLCFIRVNTHLDVGLRNAAEGFVEIFELTAVATTVAVFRAK